MAGLNDGEPDTGSRVAQALLDGQVPELSGLPLTPLLTTGSDNTLYRLGSDLVVRLPRFRDAARRLDHELNWLPRLRGLPVATPQIEHTGTPHEVYPFRWAVLRWIDGHDAWATRDRAGWYGPALGHDLADVIRHLHAMETADAPTREPGERGGPLRALDERVHWWLDQAGTLLDATAVHRIWANCLEGASEDVATVLLHGDLIPGNLLVADGRLTAILDWGGVGAGDSAQDLTPAWAVLDPAGADAFRTDLGVDDATWLRARGFALEQAIGCVVTYTPRHHALAAVMQRTLNRLLAHW